MIGQLRIGTKLKPNGNRHNVESILYRFLQAIDSEDKNNIPDPTTYAGMYKYCINVNLTYFFTEECPHNFNVLFKYFIFIMH